MPHQKGYRRCESVGVRRDPHSAIGGLAMTGRAVSDGDGTDSGASDLDEDNGVAGSALTIKVCRMRRRLTAQRPPASQPPRQRLPHAMRLIPLLWLRRN